jgi:hypothetical protein
MSKTANFHDEVHEELHDLRPTRRSSLRETLLGGRGVAIGPRIAPMHHRLRYMCDTTDTDESPEALIQRQQELEQLQGIQYRTRSWYMTAALLFGQFFTFRIWELPKAFCQIGIISSGLLSVLMSGLAAYTGLLLWRLCLRHPELRDICDVGQLLL